MIGASCSLRRYQAVGLAVAEQGAHPIGDIRALQNAVDKGDRPKESEFGRVSARSVDAFLQGF
jgi:hypothetical protein